ncbi:MAG: thiosulfate oxidation carrier complex protein SoxZ [Gammaproteobacteria bacterium]|nr:thiosulfate oxidation carrier complex protein SoxZ [Gammaproteobacteria bacterium]
MAEEMKVRAKVNNEITTVKAIMYHTMESGSRKDKETGELIPAHFIKEVKAELNGEMIISADWGTGVSKNPYWSFEFEGGKPGDVVKITWTDNKGETGTGEATIK